MPRVPGLAFVWRLRQVGVAFFRVGLQHALAYPLSFVQSQLSSVVPAFIFFFVAKLVPRPDYYESVIIGLVAGGVLDIGVRGFSREIDIALQRGWIEMYLVEPVRWRSLPFAMSLWPITQGLFTVGVIAGVSILLGAGYEWSGVPAAVFVLFLALAAGLVIGTLSAALKILAKAGDPVLFLYSLATQIFAGVYFPLSVLPEPLRIVSWSLPHTYAIAAVRNSLLPGWSQGLDVSPGTGVGVLIGFCVVGYPMAFWIYGRALEYGRKLGVLSGY